MEVAIGLKLSGYGHSVITAIEVYVCTNSGLGLWL